MALPARGAHGLQEVISGPSAWKPALAVSFQLGCRTPRGLLISCGLEQKGKHRLHCSGILKQADWGFSSRSHRDPAWSGREAGAGSQEVEPEGV